MHTVAVSLYWAQQLHLCKTLCLRKLIGREHGKNITMYFDNKGSLNLAINIETVRILTSAPPQYKVTRSILILRLYVTGRIQQVFAQFTTRTEIVLASQLSTRGTVPACAVVIGLHWPAFLHIRIPSTMPHITLCVYIIYCLILWQKTRTDGNINI
jgi:hypothetical protein